MTDSFKQKTMYWVKNEFLFLWLPRLFAVFCLVVMLLCLYGFFSYGGKNLGLNKSEDLNLPYVTVSDFLKEAETRFPFTVQNNGGSPFTTSVTFRDVSVKDNFTAVEITGYENSGEALIFKFKAPIMMSVRNGVLVWMVDPSKPNDSPDDGEFIQNVIKMNAVDIGFKEQVFDIEAHDNERLYFHLDSAKKKTWVDVLRLVIYFFLAVVGFVFALRTQSVQVIFGNRNEERGGEFEESYDWEDEEEEDDEEEEEEIYEVKPSFWDDIVFNWDGIARVVFFASLLCLAVSSVYLIQTTLQPYPSSNEVKVEEQSELVKPRSYPGGTIVVSVPPHEWEEAFPVPARVPPTSSEPRRRIIEEVLVHPDSNEFTAIGSREGEGSGGISFDGTLEIVLEDGRPYFVFGREGRGSGLSLSDMIGVFGTRVEIKADTLGAPVKKISRHTLGDILLHLDADKTRKPLERSSGASEAQSPGLPPETAPRPLALWAWFVFVASIMGLIFSIVFMFREH